MKLPMSRSLTDHLDSSAASRFRTASCSRRWPGSATGSCASRPSATGPGSWCPRWSRASRCTTGNERTCRELLRIHPEEHPVSVQLFGTRSGGDGLGGRARGGRGRGPDRHQHGLPGAEGLQDRRRRGAARGSRIARSRWRARRRAGAACRSPSSCAPGSDPGDLSGARGRAAARARRRRGRHLASTRGTPRSAKAALPNYALARELVDELPVPVLISGGLRDGRARRARRSRPPARPACCWRAARSGTRGCSSSSSGRASDRAHAGGDPRPSSTG